MTKDPSGTLDTTCFVKRANNMFLIINVLVFQIGWFASVIGSAQGMPWLGPVAALVAVTIHLRAARHPIEELMLVVACGFIGATFDSFLLATGWVGYSSGLFSSAFAPYWIITMWMLFATTLNVSMRWMRGKPVLAAAFGFVGGPLAYITGQKLGGITLINPLEALVALAVGWAIMMPVLMSLSVALDGMSKAPTLRYSWQAEKQEC